MRASDGAGIFTAARALAPSVIFIDELDALAPARGGGDSEGGGGGGMAPEPAAEMSGRIVSSLLTAMDGINTHPASAGRPLVPPTALDMSVSWNAANFMPAVRTDIYVHTKGYVCLHIHTEDAGIHCATFDSPSAVTLFSVKCLRQIRHDSTTNFSIADATAAVSLCAGVCPTAYAEY